MILAELEIYHSRPVAPTRRVALGRSTLPVDPPPGFGGVLLGGVAAAYIGGVDPDLVGDLVRLTHQLEHGQRIAQPRLRYRFQVDTVGLQRTVHRLVEDSGATRFSFDDEHGEPSQQVLAAVYAAGAVKTRVRRLVLDAVRLGIDWQGPLDGELIAALAGFGHARALPSRAVGHPVAWALEILGFERDEARARATVPVVDRDRAIPNMPAASEVQGRFRSLLREAHPDHGGSTGEAAGRIADLTEARRILLGS